MTNFKDKNYVWDSKKPTAQMLGRWQPWHAGHQKLFEEILKKTGQVNIMVRDVKGVDDNPFDFETVKKNILFYSFKIKRIVINSFYISNHYIYLSGFFKYFLKKFLMSCMPWLPST